MSTTVTFDEMFTVINATFGIVGLKNIYLMKGNGLATNRLLFVTGFINILLHVIGEVIFFFVVMNDNTVGGNFFKIADMMQCFIISSFCLVKTATMVVKRHKISELVEQFRFMWPKSNDPETARILMEAMVPTKRLCTFYTVVTNVLSMVYNTIPLLLWGINRFAGVVEQDLAMPYYIWYPYDWSKTTFIYLFTYVLQCYAGIFTTAAVSSVDCFFVLLITHVCVNFKLLHRFIIRMYDEDSVDAASKDRVFKCNLKYAVEYHNKLINICKTIEAIFSPSLLFNLLASSLILCLSTFCITICPPVRIINYALFLSSSLLEILLMSWYGNKLRDESINVAKAAYYSRWIDTEVHHQKSITMIQIRGNNPVIISAMGFFSISLSTFSSILSASWSYFTLLKTIYIKQEI